MPFVYDETEIAGSQQASRRWLVKSPQGALGSGTVEGSYSPLALQRLGDNTHWFDAQRSSGEARDHQVTSGILFSRTRSRRERTL
jgi:hypothetical protein